MKRLASFLPALALLGACTTPPAMETPPLSNDAIDVAAAEVVQEAEAPTEVKKPEAAKKPGPRAAEREVVASLGDPSQSGAWIVMTDPPADKVVVIAPDNGKQISADATPGSGGARASIDVFRALDKELTDLPLFVVRAR